MVLISRRVDGWPHFSTGRGPPARWTVMPEICYYPRCGTAIIEPPSAKRLSVEWKIVVNDEPRYIEVITSGIVDNDDSLEMAKAITYTMRTNRITKALIDHRNVVSVTGNVVDIYERPKLFKIIGPY
jgi:hypothetical protein